MQSDAETLARLHAACFSRPRPYAAAEFAALLSGPGAVLLTGAHGFLLGRCIAGEAELLTLAVDPAARRRGEGAALVARFLDAARAEGCATAFLEVAGDNPAALALYRRAGWVQAGQRRDYYAPGIDAIVMRYDLGAASQDPP